MGDWIRIKANDVISIFEKAKTGPAWGERPNEKYRCMIFWYKNRIYMTVDEFYNLKETIYSGCRYYTTELCLTLDEYNEISEEQLAAIAYNTWCAGAR